MLLESKLSKLCKTRKSMPAEIWNIPISVPRYVRDPIWRHDQRIIPVWSAITLVVWNWYIYIYTYIYIYSCSVGFKTCTIAVSIVCAPNAFRVRLFELINSTNAEDRFYDWHELALIAWIYKASRYDILSVFQWKLLWLMCLSGKATVIQTYGIVVGPTSERLRTFLKIFFCQMSLDLHVLLQYNTCKLHGNGLLCLSTMNNIHALQYSSRRTHTYICHIQYIPL